MTWATITNDDNKNTHYYEDVSSICSGGTLNNNNSDYDSGLIGRVWSISIPKKHNTQNCKLCKKMLKNKKMIKKIAQQNKTKDQVEKKCISKFQISFIDMMYNWLNYESIAKVVKTSEFKKNISKEYPKMPYGDTLIKLLVANKIHISHNEIIPISQKKEYEFHVQEY